MSFLKKGFHYLVNIVVVILVITFTPGLPPKTSFPFEAFSFVNPKALEGVLKPNKWLENPEKLHVGKLDGPEHLLNRDGAIYTALHNGDVVKIVGDNIKVLGKFGTLCYENNPLFSCGRPLGMAFDTITESLIIVDTSIGIFEFNPTTGQKKLVFTTRLGNDESTTRPGALLNSVAVAKNGDLYFTDSASDFPIHQVFKSFLANPSGRLFHYARKTGKITVLVDNLWFANGVALSPNEDFIVVSDLMRSKLVKCWLKKEKRGEIETFAEGLPGTPDNLVPDKNGIWVALPLTMDPDHPWGMQSMSRFPFVRQFISRLVALIELTFTFIDKIYPNDYAKYIAHVVGTLEMIHWTYHERSTILRFDWNGNIIAAYHAFDNTFYTHAMEMDNHVYLGSLAHNYIAKVAKQAHLYLVKPEALEGVLKPNNFLENPEKLYLGKLNGPEHLLNRDGAIYTAQNTGEVVKIVGDNIKVLGKFGYPCFDDNPSFICGRPLGMAFDTITENLIIVDTSTGIFELNPTTGQKKLVFTSRLVNDESTARPPKFFNSVEVSKNGDLYFTDSASDFQIHEGFKGFLANPSGRLLHYARKTRKITVLVDNLWIANGVALSPNEDFIVVSDFLRSKLVKCWLKKGKRGEVETFAEGLPGTPDNLTPDKNGIWAALPITMDPEHPVIFQSMSRLPLIRKFISRLVALIELTFTSIDKIYPNDYAKYVAYIVGTLELAKWTFPERSTILRFDWSGNIIAAYHAFDGGFYTHVMEMDNHLYLGSFTHNYIAKVYKRVHL